MLSVVRFHSRTESYRLAHERVLGGLSDPIDTIRIGRLRDYFGFELIVESRSNVSRIGSDTQLIESHSIAEGY